MRLFISLIAVLLISGIDSANVLFLMGIPSPSHYIFNMALATGLGARGHNVTVVSPDVDKIPPKNVHFVHLEQVYAHYYNGSEHIDLLEMSRESSLQSVFSFYDFGTYMCEGIALSKGLSVLRKYPNDFKFDLVVHDYTCGPCLLGVLPKFHYPPLIGLSAFNNPPYTTDIVGGDKLGLTTKPFYLLHYDSDMNIFQRLHNGFIAFLDSFYRKYFALPSINKQMRKMFGREIPSAANLESRHDLMLVNSHPSVDYPDSLPPNIIEVGGMQIKEPKPLPEDIKHFIDQGKKGAVLMTLGTNVRSDQLDEESIMRIIEAFRQVPDYNFLWKFETAEKINHLPKNLMIRAWLPQNDILAQPRLKLFITHAGLLSMHEATWWSVPMVGIPFVADQHRNIHKATMAGVAVKLNFQTLTTDKLKKAIVEVLGSPKYKRNMDFRSKRFRDQPEKPLERAIWWSEYMIRNQKPSHLRPAEFKLGLLGSHFWDIQLILVAFFTSFVIVVIIIYKKVFPSSRPISETKKKKN